jgi:hypothetical protein
MEYASSKHRMELFAKYLKSAIQEDNLLSVHTLEEKLLIMVCRGANAVLPFSLNWKVFFKGNWKAC